MVKPGLTALTLIDVSRSSGTDGLELLRCDPATVLVAGSDHHPVIQLGQLPGDLEADPFVAAGNQCDLAGVCHSRSSA